MRIDDLSISRKEDQVRQIPKVARIRIKNSLFDPPNFRFIESRFENYRHIVEIYVLFSIRVSIGTSSLALYVGNERIMDGKYISESEAIFFGFYPDKLIDGTPIFIGWDDSSPESRSDTGYKYKAHLT